MKLRPRQSSQNSGPLFPRNAPDILAASGSGATNRARSEPPKTRLFRWRNPEVSESERGRSRHDNSVGVVEDDFCCFSRAWLARDRFFFFLVFVQRRRRAFPKRV